MKKKEGGAELPFKMQQQKNKQLTQDDATQERETVKYYVYLNNGLFDYVDDDGDGRRYSFD